MQKTPLARRLFYVLAAAFVGVALSACDDDITVNPAPPEYPVSLTATSTNSNVTLQWSEATVSSFEEYIIVRSQDSIPDTAEPDLTGGQLIIERIDDRSETSFIDFEAPITNRVYYKVFAKIGERFLISPTVRADLSFQIIDYRVDAMTHKPATNSIIGFDRTFDVLFEYDYVQDKIISQGSANLNNPIIRSGTYNNQEEVYLNDRFTQLFIHDAADLDLKSQLFFQAGVVDFIYTDGLLFVAHDNSTIAVYDRSSGDKIDDKGTLFSSTKNLQLLSSEGGTIEFLEILQNKTFKYRYASGVLSRVGESNQISGGSQVISARKTDGSEVVAYTTGRIIDANLNSDKSVGTGLQFFNMFAFSQDNNTLVATAFDLNQPILQYFDASDSYDLIESNPIPFSPFHMFSDNGQVFLLSLQFINGGSRTVVSKYDIP